MTLKFRENAKLKNLEKGTLETWITDLEKDLKSSLPDDYRNHMLNYNGGKAIGKRIIFDASSANVVIGEDIRLKSFQYLDNGQSSLEREAKFESVIHIPKGMTICYTYSGFLMMSLAQGDFGCIYHMHSYGEPVKIASSWTEFVSYLIDFDEDA